VQDVWRSLAPKGLTKSAFDPFDGFDVKVRSLQGLCKVPGDCDDSKTENVYFE
jgi:hypothetical protein